METSLADNYPEEIAAIRQTAQRFAARDLAPDTLERDRYPFAAFDHRMVDAAAAVGLLTPTLPESHGGLGLGLNHLSVILRAVAVQDASPALLIFMQSLAGSFLAEVLPATPDFALLQPTGADSLVGLPIYHDPEELPDTVKAETTPDGCVLTGALDYVSGLPVARTVLVPAILDERPRFFLVDRNWSGVNCGQALVSLGLRACPTADLTLDQVLVPPERCLIPEAAAIFAGLADQYRAPLVGLALGLLEGCYLAALKYARDRRQAKKPIVEHDQIRNMLARMKAWLDLGDLCLPQACRSADPDARVGGSVRLSLQELFTTAVTRAATDGVQILGGYGYMKDYGQEKRMRDAKQLQAVFGGSPIRTLRILEKSLEPSRAI